MGFKNRYTYYISNHDTYYKNTNKVNSIQQLCTSFDGINELGYTKGSKEVELGGCRMLFLLGFVMTITKTQYTQ